MVSYFSGKSLKLMPPDVLILTQNEPKCVWRPGSARTRWGSLQLDLRGLLLRKGEEREGRVGEGAGRDGTMTKILVPICLYCLKCTQFGQLFLRKVIKTDTLILAQNAPKCVWRPGYARTRWGSLQRSPRPLAGFKGPTSKERGGEGRVR